MADTEVRLVLLKKENNRQTVGGMIFRFEVQTLSYEAHSYKQQEQ